MMNSSDRIVLDALKAQVKYSEQDWALIEDAVEKAGGIINVDGVARTMLEKATQSFGGNRSAAGAYAAHVRWGQGANRGATASQHKAAREQMGITEHGNTTAKGTHETFKGDKSGPFTESKTESISGPLTRFDPSIPFHQRALPAGNAKVGDKVVVPHKGNEVGTIRKVTPKGETVEIDLVGRNGDTHTMTVHQNDYFNQPIYSRPL